MIDYPNSNLFKKLSNIIDDYIQKQDRVFITITGKSGAGKSTLGKYIRKNGISDIKPSQIAVIDDSVMTIDYFGGLIRRKYKNKIDKKDNLKPFLKKIGDKKRLIFYINVTPSNRITQTDIMVWLDIDKQSQKERLTKRITEKTKVEKAMGIEPNIDNISYKEFIRGSL